MHVEKLVKTNFKAGISSYWQTFYRRHCPTQFTF